MGNELFRKSEVQIELQYRAAEWLALLPHRKKVLSLRPSQGPSVWSFACSVLSSLYQVHFLINII